MRAGHTSVAFTLDRYGHLFEGHDDELRERLDAMHALGLQAVPNGTVVELPAAPARPTADQATKKTRRSTGPELGDGVRRQGLEPRTVALRERTLVLTTRFRGERRNDTGTGSRLNLLLKPCLTIALYQ